MPTAEELQAAINAAAAGNQSAAQAAMLNQAYLANQLPVTPVNAQSQSLTAAQQQDAAYEAAKHAAAFHAQIDYAAVANMPLSQIAARYGNNYADQVQEYYTKNPTPQAQAIQQQYAAQQSMVNVGYSGMGYQQGTIVPNVLAGEGGFSGRAKEYRDTWQPLQRSRYDMGVLPERTETVPLRDLSSGMISGSKIVASGAGLVDVNMPWGEYTQVKVRDAKVLMGYSTGELGVYQKPFGHSLYNLVGGGGRNALQSGMFSVGDAQTPYVVEQGAVGKYVLPSGKGMSRLGAEAYGGVVRPLDDRRLEPNDAISRYFGEGANNLANYVAQVAGGKAEAPGAKIPWEISAKEPAMQYMGTEGIIKGSAVAPPVGDRIIGSKTVASQGVTTDAAVQPLSQQPAYFSEVSNWIKGAPVLGYIYAAGQAVSSETKQRVASFAQSAPILESVYKGGQIFELKTDTERIVAERTKSIAPMASAYKSDISSYTTDLNAYNTQKAEYESKLSVYEEQVSAYEKNKTQSGYDALSGASSELKQQQASLEAKQSLLGAKYSGLEQQRLKLEAYQSDIKKIQEPYSKAASDITGGANQEGLLTYGVGSWFGGVASGYETHIEDPVKAAVSGWGIPGEFIGGVADVPRQAAFMGQAGLIGGETISRSIPTAPGVAAAGVAMQAKGTYEMATTKPAELAGSLAGMFILGGVAKAGVTKAVGAYRTSGMEYVPIERIGYGPEGRYPINPVQSESALARSFAEGKLYPAPKEMAEGGPVPYLHGVGDVPVARLPNAPSGQTTLWTALESSSRVRGVGVGEAYLLKTSGGSEVQGMYGAPIVESYFAKVGGIIPKMVGFELPVKTPTIYSTVVEGVEAIPRAVRDTARTGDYTQVNTYIQGRSAAVPSGQAYMPLLKPEYEAIVPDLSVIEVTGRNYYTKLGGFGKSHFLGEKVPIIEQKSIGFQEAPAAIKRTAPNTEYYSGNKPLINLAYSPSVVGISRVVSPNGESTRISPTNPEAYSYRVSSRPSQGASYRIPLSGVSYSRTSTRPPTESRVPSEVSKAYSGSASYAVASSVIPSAAPSYKPYGTYRSYAISGVSAAPRSGSYPVTSTPPKYVSPYSPMPPSKYTPPYSPGPSGGSGSPTPPVPPTPPIPLPGGFDWGGAGGVTPGIRKRRAAFQETFMAGLDVGFGMGGRRPRAKSWTTPASRKRKPVVAKVKKGGKKK